MDEVTLWMFGAGVVGLTLLALLLTGPGMWSEKWGWSLFSRGKRERGAPPPAASAAGAPAARGAGEGTRADAGPAAPR